MNDEGITNLIDAIVKKAANDYRQARKMLRRKTLDTQQRNYYTWLQADTERFFKSQWFYAMGGNPEMFKALRRDCNRGDFRMTATAWGDHIIRKEPRKQRKQ